MSGDPPGMISLRRSTFTLLLLLGFVFGVAVGSSPTAERPVKTLSEAIEKISGKASNPDFRTFTKTWEIIQSKYVRRPTDVEKLIRGATGGLVESLDDPYSFYLNPEESKAFADEINGKFEGIGAELGLKDEKIVVIAPLPGAPAEHGGLRPGDTITAIDSVSTEGMNLEQAVLRIRGKEGTVVRLTVARADMDEQTLTITRERIQVKSVSLKFRELEKGKVAVVQISSFTQTTDDEFSEVSRRLLVEQPKGIVLDLRNNTGGYLDAAVSVADAFLRDGTVVIEDFGSGRRRNISADPDDPLAQFPLVILMNGGTASAAEILAGAFQDRLKTTVVGEKSFGKGSVQELEDLPDGSTVKLTVAHWLTPSGRSIDGTGIEPNETVASEQGAPAGRDAQLDRALEVLFR